MEPIVGAILETVGEHVDCHRNFQNDVNDLRKRVADLKRRRNDKVAELQILDHSEKQVKEEVRGWLEDARRVIEIEMPDIEEEVQNVSKLSWGSLGRSVRQKIQEVREIYDRGCFPEGLVIERPPPIGITLPTENMVGEVDVKEQIWGYLGENESVGIPEPTTENGCKIVITSRSRDVCRQLCHRIVKVQPLSDQESLNLFLEKVGQNIQNIPNLKETLRLIVKECAGLPLAIVVIAGSMKGVEDIREWRNALRELRKCVVGTAEGSRGDEIFNRLKFSYDRLPNSNIKNCFLYCSLYPEDWEISRATVIEDWICVGLIEELGSRQEMHDKGHTILNRLENNCLVEKGLGEGHVKMHDVLRDMALHIKSIGPNKFMVEASMLLKNIPTENVWTQDLEKVSLMRNDISYIPENMSPKCSMLSTLILENNKKLREIPECFFANMPLLKFLNLSETGIEVLPNSICNLEKLTALILHGCEHLECMPSLAKLKALKKLDLWRAGLLVVPEGIEMLANLQYLDLCCPHLKELPTRMISELSCLQYLCRYKLSTEETLRGEAATLKELENFEGGFSDLKDFNYFVSKSKHFLGGLNHYVLVVGGFEIPCFNHSRSFEHNYCFKRVILVKCKIRGEDDLVLPDDLQVLSVGDCNTVSDISTFMKNTTQLRSYYLEQCKGIECVVSSSSFTFMNNLEQLSLLELDSLQDLVKVEKTTASPALTISPSIFSNLKHLTVWCCSRIKKLFPCELLQSQGLQNLELIKVISCDMMEEIIGWEDEEEGNETVFTLPKLRRLHLESLPELKRIFPERGKMVCDSLNSIVVCDCLKVKRIPLCLVHNEQPIGHPALQEIKVYPEGWWESLEWDNPNAKNILLPLVIKTRPPGQLYPAENLNA
ncbi:hypothetical protein SLEP1_g53191 [Rubroshorea leprosula]|uniref:NB-ARC domain-containing protein n=1 Tax=Rubroshorea leprosula TaxID=152421 RepID=A0AAV5M8U0_9ROSI|nr:hypothetical protein SLEP1_g53191 [Rubroshorea leprosula]